MARKIKFDESVLQMSICDYLSRHGIFFFSVPNERSSSQDVQKIMRLKKMGMVAGIPDLCILHKKTVYFLEVKSAKGKLTEKQIIIQSILKHHGYHVATVYDIEQAIRQIIDWGIVK